MAKAKSGATTSTRIVRNKRKRPGVHSKKKSSRSKNSKLYKKRYVGQGKN